MDVQANLKPRATPGAGAAPFGDIWKLEIPAGPAGVYRLAQMDDYSPLPRRRFHHAPPWTLSLRARVSAAGLPGTWGFGVWNDPFGVSLGFGGKAGRFPALPGAAWFFHASSPNWLSLHPAVPGDGFFCAAYRPPRLPSLLLAPGLLAMPLLALKPVSRLLRRLAARIVRQEGAALALDVTEWHAYAIQWLRASVIFRVDGQEVLRTRLAPLPPLGLVIWIDNQYAAWRPDGRLGYGTLANPAARLEIQGVLIE